MAWDGEAKTLTAGKPVRTLEGEHQGNSTAEIAVHPGGKWVFASNRGHDSIAVFAAEGGAVTLKGTVPCGGKVPRSFTLSPDGKWLLAAHQESNSVQVFSFDAASGELKAKGGPVKTTCGKPVSLVFAPGK
jgi:6-phosphogluconolactonase